MRILKANTIAIFVIALFISSIMLTAMPIQAQTPNTPHGGATAGNPNGSIPLPSGVTPDVTLVPTPYLSFRPNPVGITQTIIVNMWINPALDFRRYFTNYTVEIIKPDGTKVNIGPLNSYPADTTAWFEYVVDQIGTWQLRFDFPGSYFPAGVCTQPPGLSNAGYSTNFTRSCYYTPEQTDWQNLTVQQNAVFSWPPAQLPTDYWTRPVSPELREWWSILGDYPWRGPGGGSNWPANTNTYWSSGYGFTPYVQGPNTPHIVWQKQNAISGLVGGDNGIVSFQTGGGNPTIIFQGRCYQTLTKPMPMTINGSTVVEATSVWECYDLHTGQVYWDQTGITATPSYIEYASGTPEVSGAEAAAESVTASLITISGNRLLKYNPTTGAATLNISIPTFSTNTYYMNKYVLSVQTIVPSTGTGPAPNGVFRLINWTTAGSDTNFTNRIASNATWLWDPTYSGAWSYDFSNNIAFQTMEINWLPGFPYVEIKYDNATGIRYGTNAQAFDLRTNTLKWNVTYISESLYIMIDYVADHGKVAILEMNNKTQGPYNFLVLDQFTGNLVYKGGAMDYPWSNSAFGAYSIQSAYGLFYREAYDGVWAFYWDNGSVAWHYELHANPYETTYTDKNGTSGYSFNAGATIADGKLYTYNTEHTPSQPLTRGWCLVCINATSGEGIWKIDGSMAPGPIADGYITASDIYNGFTYGFGKGTSATTVASPDTVVLLGTSVVIKGTVLDTSPAQPSTPCVSAASMETQMEYLHMQRPIDGLYHNETIIGVPVTLTAIGSDGSVIDIGTTTTNGYFGTYGVSWTPTKQDTYTITASFAGDDSYGSSSGGTIMSIGPAPTTPTPSSSTSPSSGVTSDTMLLYGILVAVVIAIIIGIIALVRKR